MAAYVLTSTEGLSHADWLAYRNMGIGGSDASVVCGVNKYKSPLELWMEKTGQKPPEKAGEEAYWGTVLEPLITEEFTRRTGIKIIPVKQIIQSKHYPFMLANLDGVCHCPTQGKCVFEGKTASAYKAGEWDGDAVPYVYVLQIQHYLYVTGYSGAYIAVLIGGNTFRWTFVKRDEELISMIIRYEKDFWMHVKDDIPLPPDGSKACSDYLKRRYPDSIPLSKITLPDSAIALIHQYKKADEQVVIFEEQKQKAANLLKNMLGEHEKGIIRDGYVKWSTITKNRFSSKLLEAEQPDIHAKYKVETSERRFSIKEPSETSSGKAYEEATLQEAG